MTIEYIKKIYFEVSCNTSGVARDYGFSVEESRYFRKIIKENEKNWTDEFLEMKKQQISTKDIHNMKYIIDLMRDFWKYKRACKNYDQLYELTKLHYNIFKNEDKYNFSFYDEEMCDVYCSYYSLLLFNKDIFCEILENFKEKTLLDYLKNNYPKKYISTINKLKLILKKDKYKDTIHKFITSKLKDYL